MARRILLVAGDPSGDRIAGRLAEEIHRREPTAELFGYGGPAMAAAGVEVLFDLPGLSAIGLADALPKLPLGKLQHARLCRLLRASPPDAAVLVDCGAFNLPLAAELRRLGVPALGYFPPGSWSGSRKRARAVAASYAAVATPFPQALPAYAALGFPATLVGHPLVEELAPLRAQRAGGVKRPPTLALLPGSRPQEIRHILPPMLAAARLLRDALPELQVVVSQAHSAPAAPFERAIAAGGVPVTLVGGSRDALLGADAALVKSGTVTLEAALLGVPMVVCYRGSHTAYLVASVYYWPRPKFFAMPNIMVDRRVVPELFQYRVTGQRLAAEVKPLLADTAARGEQLAGLAEATAALTGDRPTERTADLLFDLLSRGSRSPA